MSKNKIIKSVSLNLANEDDQAILKHVKRRNFSGYVKKLILADIQSKAVSEPNVVDNKVPNKVPKPASASDRLEQLKRTRPFISQSKG